MPTGTLQHDYELSSADIDTFMRDGFVIVEDLIPTELAVEVRERYESLFDGEFETGLVPDEWNWKAGRDAPELTRQICNGWKSDRLIASVVLAPHIGKACATLGRWPGARLSQDNLIWKPPGGRALGYHQDSSYEQWAIPSDWVSCWIALDDCRAETGTVQYVRGSHRWGESPMIGEFHGPADPTKDLREAAGRAGVVEPDFVPVEVKAGSGAFHFGWTWHGSGVSTAEVPRRSLVAHMTSSEARFHPTNTGYIYSRYKRFGDDTMDESFFPITWRDDGYRSPFIEPYTAASGGWAADL